MNIDLYALLTPPGNSSTDMCQRVFTLGPPFLHMLNKMVQNGKKLGNGEDWEDCFFKSGIVLK